MAEVKRPGIDLETSEVFETSDLPEADQHYFQNDETTDSIETIHLTSNEAFGRFKAANVDNRSVDFSDRIRLSRRKGYIVWKGEEESQPVEEETPVKKYKRLNCEVRELLDEIAAAKDRKDSTIQTGTLETLSVQADILHKHLLEMRLEDVLGKHALHTMTDPQAAVRERLVSQMNEIKALKVDASGDQANLQGSGSVYNLMLKPDTSRLQAQSAVARVAARISRLERILGSNSEDLSILSMETGRKTLMEAVSVLSAKTIVLEPKNLDHIEGRLAVLQQKVGEEETEAGGDHDDQLDQIHQLAKISDKSAQLAATVPDVIDRMEALSPLHSQAAELSQSMIELESVQKQLLVQLSNNSSLLKEIQTKFQGNLASINNNFENLHARIKAVKSGKK